MKRTATFDMKILAIDFSTSRRSVALVRSTGSTSTVLGQSEERGTKDTNAFQLIRNVLDQAGSQPSDVDALAIGLGPGSYGGIRVSLSLAQGWQLATGIKTAGIDTTRVLAETARQKGCRGDTHIVMDAQRNEFHHSRFELDDRVATLVGPLKIVSRAELETWFTDKSLFVGPDLSSRLDGVTETYPDAADLGRLALDHTEFVPANQLTPVYLRPVAFAKAPPPRTFL